MSKIEFPVSGFWNSLGVVSGYFCFLNIIIIIFDMIYRQSSYPNIGLVVAQAFLTILFFEVILILFAIGYKKKLMLIKYKQEEKNGRRTNK